MSRLPTPGSDDGTWGGLLNDFLSQEHNADGSQKALPVSKITPSASNGDVLTTSSGATVWATPGTGGSPSGAAGGSLSGTYPNPGIATGAVTTSQIADGTITDIDISGTAAIARSKLDSSTTTSLGKADSAEQAANKGAISGYAGLDGSSKVPIANLPTGSNSSSVAIGNDGRFAGSAAGTAGAALSATDTSVTNARTPTGAAGGGLTGTYPNPTLAGNSVSSSNIVDGTIVNADISSSAAVAVSKLAPSVTDTQVLTTVSGVTAWANAPSGGGSPTGSAGGSLTGTYPNPTIASAVITDANVAAANVDGVVGTPSLRTLGAGSQQAAAGNDTRIVGAAQIIETVNTQATSGASQTLADPTNASINNITLTAACTFTFPTAVAGKTFTLVLRQDVTGGRTVVWPGTVKWASGSAPTLTVTGNAVDVFTFVCVDGTNWLAFTASKDLR